MKSSRPRTGIWIAVLAGHLLLAVLLQNAGVWRERGAAAPQRPAIVLRLLPGGRPGPVAAAAAPAPPAVRRARPAADAVNVPDAAALRPDGDVTGPTAPAAPTPTAPPPLVLDLPRAASSPERRHPGLSDPRANTARPTLESRIAGAIGGDAHLREEALFDGRLRVRQDNDCVEVRPNTADQLDPFNRAVRPLPRAVKPC